MATATQETTAQQNGELVVLQVPMEKIDPNPFNPRMITENDPRIISLAESIRLKGLQQPVKLRPVGKRFQIVFGECRHRACKRVGLKTIAALVQTMDDREALELTMTENLHRNDLHCLEEARGVELLLEKWNQDPRAVAEHFGKSPGWVARRARLATLTEAWRKAIQNPEHPVSRWSVAHLELVARLAPSVQDEFLEEQFGREKWRWHHSDFWSTTVADLERDLKEYFRDLSHAPWGLDDAELHQAAGPCTLCPKRSAANPGLFDELAEPNGKRPKQKTDRCLDAHCWKEKARLFQEARIQELKIEYPNLAFVRLGHEDVEDVPEKTYFEHQVKKVKPEDEGAIPAMVLGRGTLQWIKPLAQQQQTNRGPRSSGVPTPLAERKKMHERKRHVRAVEDFRKALAQQHAPKIETSIALAIAFGINAHGDHNRAQAHAVTKLKKQSLKQLSETLWKPVRDRLVALVTFGYGAPSPSQAQWIFGLAVQIGQLVDIDAKAMHVAACKALPEPKSWALLKADGTPKAQPQPRKAAK